MLPYEDKEIQALKLELKLLEKRLQTLVDKKNDCDIDIDAFNREYNLELGEVIQKVLSLREAFFHLLITSKESAFRTKKAAWCNPPINNRDGFNRSLQHINKTIKKGTRRCLSLSRLYGG